MSLVRIAVAGGAPYEVVVGPGALAELPRHLAHGGGAAVLTDTTVERLHAARLGAAEELPRLALPPGEDAKRLATLERVLDFLAAAGLDRGSTLVALGGGVVGDVGGLAAALYMRGIRCVQCPTTLLAQVDASVGGKTAVNLAAGKNLVGAFHAPAAVLADTATLATLPEEELRAGLGEALKTAVIGDGELLALLEERADAARAGDPGVLGEIVARCVRVKAGICARDEREHGERRHLNLGHTFAHAIEHAAGFGRIPHGVAVGTGVALALRASRSTGLLEEHGLPERVAALLGRLGLAASLGELRARYGVGLAPEDLLAGMRHDKKGRAGRPALVLVRGTGRPAAGIELAPAALDELLA